MKFFKTKIAIFFLLMYLLPCITGVLFTNVSREKKITVWNHQAQTASEMDISDYLIGVVAAEMPCEFQNEALKAQAVAARTYLVSKQKCEKSQNCQICTDPGHCQAFKTPAELKKQWGSDYHKNYKKIYRAVKDTTDEIIVYNNKPISAVFHSTSSGKTENSEDVWSEKLPYLRSVDSSLDVNSPKYYSNKTVSVDEFCKIIKKETGTEIKDIQLGNITHTRGGNVDSIQINNINLTGTKVRSLFDLNSACFDISIENDCVSFVTKGYGHGVGMSQYGANYLAEAGKSYTDIIKKYYTGVEIVKSDYAYISN